MWFESPWRGAHVKFSHIKDETRAGRGADARPLSRRTPISLLSFPGRWAFLLLCLAWGQKNSKRDLIVSPGWYWQQLPVTLPRLWSCSWDISCSQRTSMASSFPQSPYGDPVDAKASHSDALVSYILVLGNLQRLDFLLLVCSMPL